MTALRALAVRVAMPMTPRERAQLSLLGLSIGDAFGHSMMWCAERIPPRLEPPAPWSWSDDTEMALSLVATLEQHGRIDQDDLARRFVANFHEARMYGSGMQDEFFPRLKAGERWQVVSASLFNGQGSLGNGSAMRVAPLGAWFAADLARAADEASASSQVTHSHPEAIAGAIAVAVAAAAAYGLRGSRAPDQPRALIERVLPFVPVGRVRDGLVKAAALGRRTHRDEVVATLGNGARVTAADTVPFALWSAARDLADYPKAIWNVVSATGDMDTNAAIVGGIVALFVGAEGIPARWVRAREPLP